MARITDFASLRDLILFKTDEEDGTAFADEIASFVQLAEQRMWYGNADKVPKVRCRAMEQSVQLTFTNGEADLPERYLEQRGLFWPSNPISTPPYEAPRTFWVLQLENQSASAALAYTVEGSKIYVRPSLTGEARFLYYQAFEGLSAAADTNWLLQNAPAVYVEAVLIEAYRHLEDADEEAKAASRYQMAVMGLNNTEAQSRIGGNRLVRSTRW